jgi:hypothetical protein
VIKRFNHTREISINKSQTFKGNKQSLPSKPCKTCGREMTWRKAWAKNWEQVLYCSDKCRAGKANASSLAERDLHRV